jgi:hypothetical protein
MATGWPMKTTYADGDVYAAQDVNDITGTINLLGSSVAYTAGKNRLINGDFRINQRNFTSVTTGFSFDRWTQFNGGTTGTLTTTPQTFTPGAAPVAGYEGSTYVQCITAAGASADTYALYGQKIEDVRTFAGQTVTVSFWAKAASGTPKVALEMEQVFGTGGSPSAGVGTAGGSVTISTSWARYSITMAVPSISGKTIGTTANTSLVQLNLWLSAGSSFNSRASSIGLQNNTFQIWGVQAEQGSTATAFQTATGTIQGELAACQRYYYRIVIDEVGGRLGMGFVNATNGGELTVPFPVTMRTRPTALETTGTATDYQMLTAGNTITTCNLTPAFSRAAVIQGVVAMFVASGVVAGQAFAGRVAVANAYFGWSAEL